MLSHEIGVTGLPSEINGDARYHRVNKFVAYTLNGIRALHQQVLVSIEVAPPVELHKTGIKAARARIVCGIASKPNACVNQTLTGAQLQDVMGTGAQIGAQIDALDPTRTTGPTQVVVVAAVGTEPEAGAVLPPAQAHHLVFDTVATTHHLGQHTLRIHQITRDDVDAAEESPCAIGR